MAWSPLHAEAKAMEEAIRFVKDSGITPCTFLTDNETLVQACNNFEPPVNVDWNLEGVQRDFQDPGIIQERHLL